MVHRGTDLLALWLPRLDRARVDPVRGPDRYLYAWAALVGVYQLDATAASGVAQFNGVPNIAIPLGATLTRGTIRH